MRRLAAVVLLILGVGALPPPAAGAGKTSFTTDWDCREALIAFPVPVENVRDKVPEQFTIAQEDSGVATFAVFAEHCLTSIDDGPWIPHVLSGAFVRLEEEGTNFDFLWGTDSREYYKELNRLGTGDYVPGSRLEITNIGGQTNISEADIPWVESPFSFALVTGEPSHPRQETTSVHILDGRRGLVWSAYVHDIEVSGGSGEIRFTPGTLLAEIAGSDQVTGAALFGEFTIEDATTELRQ